MKTRSIIGRIAVGAFLVSLIPYSVHKDEDTGEIEVRSLLWGLRKTPHKEGEDKDRYSFAIPPSGLDEEKAEDTANT